MFRKEHWLSFRSGFAVFSIAGAIALAACSDPLSRASRASQDRSRPLVLIPNIDDDNGDGIPDGSAAPLEAGADDDMLQIRVFPDGELPQGAMVRAGIPGPWTAFARAFVRTDSPAGSRFVAPPVELDPAAARKQGVVIGIEAADFASPDRPPTIEVEITFETREGRPLHEEKLLCRVAPFLLSSCLDPAERVQVVRTKATEGFVRNLEPLVQAAGAGLEIIEDAAIPEHDIWIQDAVEIGSATDGERLMHVALHGNRGRELDAVFAKKALARDSGVVKKGGFRG
ncbi:MAG TPA: protein-arginine deiminase family protein, partial [Acidobacteriota bacterium]|nr:protein-arginine deiminase family protein [Acidobacteriota bacterium]